MSIKLLFHALAIISGVIAGGCALLSSHNRIVLFASYPAVTDKVILEIEIPAPVISNQKKFADLVQKVEKIKEKQQGEWGAGDVGAATAAVP